MNELLDNTNPNSKNEYLGGLSTRILLKELRDRGIEFAGLSITVRQEININDI